MQGWLRWINYINPVAYAFESLMTNEFSDRKFPCAPYSLIPSHDDISNRICSVVGSQVGLDFVLGDDYMASAFSYDKAHEWRNVGILFAFIVGLGAVYLVSAEFIAPKKSKGEVLVFRRGQAPAVLAHQNTVDIESVQGTAPNAKQPNSPVTAAIQRQTAIFQ